MRAPTPSELGWNRNINSHVSHVTVMYSIRTPHVLFLRQLLEYMLCKMRGLNEGEDNGQGVRRLLTNSQYPSTLFPTNKSTNLQGPQKPLI